MKSAIIINPFAGKRQASRIRRLAEKMAADLGVALSVKTIKGPQDGFELARAAVNEGADRVVCAGGNGSLNAVAKGLIGTGAPLGVIPMGSGNGYARSLGIPQNAAEALQVAFTSGSRPMDVGYLNDRPFLGTAGVGFDARVAERFDRTKRRGMMGYLRIILDEIVRAKTIHVQVTANGQTSEADLLMLVFCNTGEFGNGARISPRSRPDDGLAELQLVRKPSLGALPLAFVRLYTHRVDRLRHIRSVPATEAVIIQNDALAHLDGEPVAVGHTLHFRLEPNRISVIVPSSSPGAMPFRLRC